MSLTKILVPGVILAGGASRRFGSPKAEAVLGGRTLLAHAVSRLEQQISGPIAINENQPLAPNGDQVQIRDALIGDFGPIVGIYTAMKWARSEGYAQVITIPVDTPFFPEDLARRLSSAGVPSAACVEDRLHPVFALWDTDAFAMIEAEIRDGMRALHRWVETCGARRVDFADAGPEAFFNINTREDLAEAERRMAQRDLS
jgi:molybdopterin-guanine dinucleotide biosynthesis protein A